jgi:hypothetical protein
LIRFLAKYLAAVLIAALAMSSAALADEPVYLPAEPLVIETAGGKTLTFNAEIADDDAKRSHGMMFRRKMQDSEAMLFVWPEPYEAGHAVHRPGRAHCSNCPRNGSALA